MKNKLMMMLMATAFVPMLAISAHAADVVVDDGAFIPSTENGDTSNVDVVIPEGTDVQVINELPTYGDDALEEPVLVVDDGAFLPTEDNGDVANVDTDIPDGGLHVVDGLEVADAGDSTDAGDAGSSAGDAGDVPTHDDADIGIVCCTNPDDTAVEDPAVDGGVVGPEGEDVHVINEFPMNDGEGTVEKEMMETMVPMNDSVGAAEAPEVNDAAVQAEVPEIHQPSTEKYNN